METYKPTPSLKTMLENMPAAYQGIYICASKFRVATTPPLTECVVTCADSRVVPYEIFGLARGGDLSNLLLESA